MAIPYAKIGPDQLDLDALSQRIIAENGIVTKKDGVPSNIADEVEKIGGVASSNIAKAHISEDDASFKWHSGFSDNENTKALFKDRNTVLNSVNLGGRPADDFMTKSDGTSIGTVQEAMIEAYSGEISDLKEELYQLRCELERNNYIQDYGMYSGISDHFDKNKYRNIQKPLGSFEAVGYNYKDILSVTDEVYELFDKYDYICLVDKENRYCIRQIIEKTDDGLKLKFNTKTSFVYGGTILDKNIPEEKELLEAATDSTLFVFKSRGIIHNGLYKFATKPENQPSSSIRFYSGLTDDRKRKSLILSNSGEGIAYSFRVAGSASERDSIENYDEAGSIISHQGYLESFTVVVRPYGEPGELECYILDKKDLPRFKNPVQFENDYKSGKLEGGAPIRFFSKSSWIYKENNKSIKQYAKFSFEKDGQYPLMSRDEDCNDEKVEYVAIICAKNMPAGSYYSLLCLQNNNTTESEDSEERDLEINNEMYSYKEQADESVNLAVVKAKDNCDLFFQIVTLKAEDNLPQPLSSGLYTLHYYNQNLKCHQSARSGFQSARLMLRIKREGKFKANISSYEPECFSSNSQLAVKPDGSALDTLAYSYLTNSDAYVDKQKVVEENLFDTMQIPVVVGNNLTTIGAIKTGESSASEYLQPASFILACNDDKVYRLGYIVAIKAREISFDRETGEYKKGGYVRKVMKLVAVAKDYDADSSNYSDRLIFEADFDKDKEYNDFELQLYWQNQMITKSPISDLVYEKREELMGALKDVVISLVHKI